MGKAEIEGTWYRAKSIRVFRDKSRHVWFAVLVLSGPMMGQTKAVPAGSFRFGD